MKFMVIPRNQIKVEGYHLRFKSGAMNIDELVESIREHGLISPLAVSKKKDHYLVIAGERRLQALDKLKWKEVPCVILNVPGEDERLFMGIAENSERMEISPLERAMAFKEEVDTYGHTHEYVANKIGRNRSYVTNHTRLLDRLHPKLLRYLHKGEINFGQAEALMKLDDKEEQLRIADLTIEKSYTVRDVRLAVDQARPAEELTGEEIELNEVEKDIRKEFGEDWRILVNIIQGKKLETIQLKFGSRGEIKSLAGRLMKAVS